MYPLYTLLLTLFGVLSLPRLLWRSARGAGYHRDWRERLGWGATQQRAARQALWFHAASVGETQGLQPIIAELRARFPHAPVIFSTFTPAGKAMAQRLLPETASVFLLPFDWPWVMRRLMRRLRPLALIIQETELWPNCLRAAACQGVPVIAVNARLSPRSTRRYRWIRSLMRRVLADVTLILAQTQESAQRFEALGAAAQRLKVVGNTNIDRALLTRPNAPPPYALTMLAKGRRVWAGGSTHEGEETILLDVYRRVLQDHPDVLLVLAPRHLERVEAVARQIQAAGFRAVRRSAYDAEAADALSGDAVVILDTMGELVALYGLCGLAFVGGSLAPIGGHNILEPAMFAKPVMFGPHMHHFPDLAQMLVAADGAVQVADAGALCREVAGLLQQPEKAELMGRRAYQALQANRGALAAVVDEITRVLRGDA